MIRTIRHAALALTTSCLSAGISSGQAMYVESCSLGCSNGSGGTQVSCSLVNVYENSEISVRFSRPVDPSSVAASTFIVVDVFNGLSIAGARFVDPHDAQRVVFRPALSFDAFAQAHYAFAPGGIYQVFVHGQAQGDPGPFITSSDFGPQMNQSRLQCNVIANLGVLDVGALFCAGDGSASPCPCGPNAGGRGGCPSSVALSGAILEAFGAPELVNDTLLLRGLAMPDAAVLYFQGTAPANGGNGSAFGDGLRCVTGSVRRLGTLNNAQGWSAYPGPGQARVSVAGQVTMPATLRYQAWYRNAAAFCTADTFNLTNGITVVWTL
jgi:hypothetical protein